MNTIIYASTSGSTALVASEMAKMLGDATEMIDLKSFEPSALGSPGGRSLVLAGTPTYGLGQWHSLWAAKLASVLPVLKSARNVALFGLGDARFHGQTFCGGIGCLHDELARSGLTPIGSSSAQKYDYCSTPSLRAGVFPGFVIDYRLDRRQAPMQIRQWLGSL